MAESKDLENLDEEFEMATQHVQTLAGDLDSERLLYLYARYKQANEGPCNIPKPGFFDFKNKQKWEAWNSLGKMEKPQAKEEYIATVKTIDPDWSCKLEGKCKSAPKGLGLCVSTLINHDLELSDHQKTAFDWVKEANVDKLKSLQEMNQLNVNQVDEEGLTLLHWASDRGYLDVVSFLLDVGANINQKDNEGQTALHYACSCGHPEVVKELLNHKADAAIKDNEGLLAVDLVEISEIKEMFPS